MISDLEKKIQKCVNLADEFLDDYESLIFRVRELENTVERLEKERRELRRRVEGVVERVEAHMSVRS
ncbi:MAG: hypothetical protein GKS04_02250 [Candidatus Mycalebacterium zealandia]|nr:MAG: hypothetical protein GKS04_02250 [Candidatus Mycalebacterium zealandia]